MDYAVDKMFRFILQIFILQIYKKKLLGVTLVVDIWMWVLLKSEFEWGFCTRKVTLSAYTDCVPYKSDVLGRTLNYILWAGSNSELLGSLEDFFITITWRGHECRRLVDFNSLSIYVGLFYV